MKQLLQIFSIVIIFFALVKAKTHTYTGKGWWVETVGQDNPRYRFGLTNNKTSHSQIEFSKLFEVIWDEKKDEYIGANNDMFPLNNLDWTLTEPK